MLKASLFVLLSIAVAALFVDAQTTTTTPQTTTPTTTTTSPTTTSPSSPSSFGYHQSGGDWDGACVEDLSQSPIDIDLPLGVGGDDSKQLVLYYPFVNAWREGLTVVHTGTSIRVTAKTGTKGNMGFLVQGGRRYLVRDIQFRAPAEHRIRGEQFPLEMQITHQKDGAKADYDLVILSVLFRASNTSNAWLDETLIWNRLPFAPGRRTMLTGNFQLGGGIDGLQQGYFSYVGSTTAPPCTTGATWFVLEAIQDVSVRQIRLINNIFLNNASFAQGRGNNRAVQPLNGRKVILYNHKQVGDGDFRGYQFNYEGYFNPEDLDAPNAGLTAAPELFNASKALAELERALPATLPELYADTTVWDGVCKSGRYQSPINVQLGYGSPHGDFEMELNYEQGLGKLKNIGIAIVLEGSFGGMKLDDFEYNITQISFHAPAEHTIDGRRTAMEMQIVHTRSTALLQSSSVETSILSILFHESAFEESRFLNSIGFDQIPATPGLRSAEFRVNLNLLDGLRDGYYSYAGSLSRPPCTEGVKRFVLRTIQEASSTQLAKLRGVYSGNSRPVQPRNKRGVLVHNLRYHTEILPQPRNPNPIPQ